MRIYDVLYAMNTGDATPKARPFDNLLGQALSGDTEEKTIDFTPVISISDAKAGAVLDYQCKITATQTGTNPSPQNICPITGWTGANIHVNSDIIPVSWQSEAGIVYGGVRNLTTGTLTVDKMQFVFDGSDENWSIAATGTNRVFRLNSAFNPGIVRARDNTYICNMATLTRQIVGIENLGVSYWFFRTTDSTGSSGQFDLLVGTSTDDVNTTMEEFKTMLVNNPMVIVADIKVPITYNLTPTEITLSEGTNTIWADCGDSKMTYLAKK